ncbi:hypothetical protein PLIIFM63780_005143 [Purpureocillium lilacinum]|uniref:CFEM domain-containing protein n=1 Tax=Purpureocillium lilacinum TaxID=33203 RepID=A0A179H917_PURLI|nr:CFEM domain-containing protein [Purpureocillium lilacinum]PWI70213.1 hypothetical protein PCL_00357 [Purpureocillium lilacinum]GJN67698.1 hypothetical protein PLICBS_001726 [Purpureocillium lilacinum]GJN81608.1 hypothetical protein PLIIFM63780_005143 [Purpureocillium lilacinum]
MKAAIFTLAGLAAVASAQSGCAVNCFTSVVTEHPPLECKEANMYLCFCKGQDLQNYFAECAYSKCESEAEGAINFGVSLCKDMGIVIAPPKRPSSSSAAQQPSAQSSTPVAATSTPASGAPETTLVTTAAPSKSTSAESHATSSHAAESTAAVSSSTKQSSAPTNGTSTQPTPTSVVVNKAMSLNTVPGALVIAGLGAVAFQML